MSQAILGMRIDGIWHTGVFILNKEAVVFNVFLLAILVKDREDRIVYKNTE